jgi:hypothetical protein
MAKVGDGTLVTWVDGQDVDAVDINRNFEVLRVANNDTDSIANTAGSTVDAKVKVVQDDLDAKYSELVQVDTDAANLFVATIADVRSEFSSVDAQIIEDYTSADSNLQTQVNSKITALEADTKISAAISTVVAGNAIIPVGSTFPDPGNGRINGEEFILQNTDNSFKLYFYNILIGAWVSAYDYLTVPSATTFSKGIVQLIDDNTGGSRNMAPTQRALGNHVNDAIRHVTQVDKDNWNTKQYDLQKTRSIELGNAVNSGAAPAFIDFHTNTSASRTDFDARIIATAIDSTANGKAYLEVNASDVQFYLEGDSFSIKSLKQSVSDGKAQVASAITGKGQPTASDATFATMANNINNISLDPKILTGNMNTGIVSSGINTGLTFNIPGLPKTPVAFKVTMSNMQYVSGSGTTNYSLNTPIEFVYNLTNRVATLTGTNPPFTFLITVSGTQLTVYVQYNTGSVTTVRYSLDAFTAIY